MYNTHLNSQVNIGRKFFLSNQHKEFTVALCPTFVRETPIPIASMSRAPNKNTALVLSEEGESHKK